MKKFKYVMVLCLFLSLELKALEKGDQTHNDHSQEKMDIRLKNTKNTKENKKEDHEKHDEHDDHDEHGEDKDHDDHKDHNDADDKHGHGEKDSHAHEDSKAVGAGKAITKVTEDGAIELSQKAVKTLGIESKKISSKLVEIPKDVIVSSKAFVGVYIKRGELFKLIPAAIKEKRENSFLVELSDFKALDEIIIKGVALLNIADVYSKDKSNYGHSH